MSLHSWRSSAPLAGIHSVSFFYVCWTENHFKLYIVSRSRCWDSYRRFSRGVVWCRTANRCKYSCSLQIWLTSFAVYLWVSSQTLRACNNLILKRLEQIVPPTLRDVFQPIIIIMLRPLWPSAYVGPSPQLFELILIETINQLGIRFQPDLTLSPDESTKSASCWSWWWLPSNLAYLNEGSPASTTSTTSTSALTVITLINVRLVPTLERESAKDGSECLVST